MKQKNLLFILTGSGFIKHSSRGLGFTTLGCKTNHPKVLAADHHAGLFLRLCANCSSAPSPLHSGSRLQEEIEDQSAKGTSCPYLIPLKGFSPAVALTPQPPTKRQRLQPPVPGGYGIPQHLEASSCPQPSHLWRFCIQVSLLRHRPSNSFPWHHRGQFSETFRRTDFQQVLPAKHKAQWLLCHSHVPFMKIWMSAPWGEKGRGENSPPFLGQSQSSPSTGLPARDIIVAHPLL